MQYKKDRLNSFYGYRKTCDNHQFFSYQIDFRYFFSILRLAATFPANQAIPGMEPKCQIWLKFINKTIDF
jgi:hypothetical protein